jgi:hypothetical protein
VDAEGNKTSPETEVKLMAENTRNTETDVSGGTLDEELAGVLTAISVVSRRLARKLLELQRPDESEKEGGNDNKRDE